MSSRAVRGWKRVGNSHWHGAASSALVSRSRAVPAGGRRSKPSPRLFSLREVRSPGPAEPSGPSEFPAGPHFHSNRPRVSVRPNGAHPVVCAILSLARLMPC